MTMSEQSDKRPGEASAPHSSPEKQTSTSAAEWQAPSRPMPAKEYQRRSSAPPRLQASKQTGVAVSSTPAQTTSAPASRPPQQRRRVGFRVLVTLLLLIIVVALGSIVGQRLLNGPSIVPALTAQSPANVGSFVQPPLNTQQIDNLRHLVTHMRYKQLASLYVSHMTLDEELGQLIMVEYGDTSYSADLNMMVNQLHAGGVIMYEFQMMTAGQTRHDIDLMQKNATFPLLVSTDEEGGIVHRLINIYPPRPSALSIYESGNPTYAADQGHKVAHDLKALGINVNLAPDVDVALIPNAPDQVTRTFGFTTSSVIQYAGPYIKAMQSDGVLACIKHFPGLGDANIDAHFGLPVVNRTKAQIYSTELVPFKHFIQTPDKLENPGMIMPTDVLMSSIDPTYPAELSHIFMTDILRKQFGYDGVVLTDALYMKGVEINGQQVSMPQAAVMALNAGDDMLLGPTGAGQMIDMLNGLRTALQNGTLSKTRVDEAATRIIALKMQSGLMPAVPPQN
jgi:beta-N-acetylhexosaminidase